MYKLMCMAFNGDCVTDREEFDTPADAWEYEADMGSKWYFYPFHFVITESKLTIKDSPDGLEYFNGKRVLTVSNFFAIVSHLPETDGADIDEFLSFLYTIWHETIALDKK